jgi:ribose transport system substrate-binding protein
MRGLAKTLICLAAVVGIALMAGCGSSGSSSSSTTSSSNSGGAAAASTDNSAGLQRAQQMVDQHKPIQTFTPPGAAFDASKAKGKKVFILPVSSNVPFNVLTGDAATAAYKQVGVSVTTFPTQGQPSQWVQGMNQAIASKVDAIDLIGLDPQAIVPQLAEAKKAGIKVIEDHFIDAKHPNPKGYENVTARIPAPYIEAGKLQAAYAITDTKGKADAIFVTSKDLLSAGDVLTGMQQEFQADCPSCKSTVVNVPFNDWASKMQTAIQSAIATNPNANYVIPVFDGMVQFAEPAVRAAGAQGRVKIASYNATPSVLNLMRDGNIISMDSVESYDWLGWALADQTLRVMLGVKPVPTENVKLRLFDKSNVSEAGVPAKVNKGYGQAYLTGYKKLWGLG